MERKARELPGTVAVKEPKPARKPKPGLTAKDYLDELRALKKPKEDEEFAFFSDDLFTHPVTEWIPSGSLAIDKLTGGGWPVGRISECAAWESVGKSTLLDQSIAQCQRIGGVACLIDTEAARDERYSRLLGVDLDKLIVHSAETIEAAFTGIDKMLAVQEKLVDEAKGKAQPPILFIVWDSVGGTPTVAERDGAADEAHVMEAARSIKMNFRRLALRLSSLRAALVCTNHFYQTIGPFASLKTYGGSGIRYFTSLRVWLTKKDTLRMGTEQVGHAIEAKLKKTRIGPPTAPVEVGLLWNAGIDNAYSLFEWGKTHGVSPEHRWVALHGSWYYLMLPDGTHETFQRGFVGLGELFQRRMDVYELMATAYMKG